MRGRQSGKLANFSWGILRIEDVGLCPSVWSTRDRSRDIKYSSTLFDGLEIVPSFTILNSSSSSSSSFSFSFFLARQVTRNATWPSNEYVYDGGSRRKWDRGGEGRRKEREKRCLCNARGPVHPLRIYSWTREIFRDAVWKRWAANFSDGLSHGAWIRKFRVIKLESCFSRGR